MGKNAPRYHSQFGEDFLLWRLFDFKRTGFYVDVGAFDGVYLSNTFSFEQQGWSGICIEPHPRYFKLCQQARPRSVCLNVACVSDENRHTIEFYTEELGLLSGVRGDREDDVRSRHQKHGLRFEGFDRLTVPAATLNAVLNENLPPGTAIDFISIDVEGTEIEVLRGLDLSRFRPRAIVIEANSREDRESLNAYLIGSGYVNAGRLAVNVFYVRDTGDAEKLRAVLVDCEVESDSHPLVEQYTLSRPECGVIRGKRLIWETPKRKRCIGKRIRNRLLALLRR